MKKLNIFACPFCGEVVASYGKPEITCCGTKLFPLEISQHNEQAKVTEFDGEYILHFNSPMTKSEHIIAVIAEYYDRFEMIRLFAEQAPEAHISKIAGARIIVVETGLSGIKAYFL